MWTGIHVHIVPDRLTADDLEALCDQSMQGERRARRLLTHNDVQKHVAEILDLEEAGINSMIKQRDISSIDAKKRKPDLLTLTKGMPWKKYGAMD